jgi:hypothetical protein
MKKMILLLSFILISSINIYSQEGKTSENDKYIETIGTMSSSGLYLTYLSISVIKQNIDLDEKPEYFKDYDKVIGSVISTIDMNVAGLTRLKKSGVLNETDIQFIGNLNDVFLMLKKDAKLLSAYLNSQKDDDYKSFSDYHDTLYNTMAQFFKSDNK